MHILSFALPSCRNLLEGDDGSFGWDGFEVRWVLSTASLKSVSSVIEYRKNMLVVLCPRRSMHTFSGTPARRMFRAAVLRKSWKSFPFKLAFLSFSLQDTLEGIRSQHFPAIASAPNAYFVYHGPLACTWIDSEKSAIYIHAILNHQETPLYVISLICKHELLHHQIVPREINGLRQQHPPEFWEAEKAIAPERDQAWVRTSERK